MSVSFDFPKETQDLLAELRDWSVQEVRPLARIADTEQTKYFAAAQRAVDSCPIDISPLSIPELGARQSGTGKHYVASEDQGGHVLGALCMEAMTYGDGWAWGALPANANLEKIVEVIGTDAQKEQWIDPNDRNVLSSFAFTEDHCGSDIAAITTRAVRDGDEWVINGRKRFSSQGAEATNMLVFLTIDPALGMRGLRGIVIPGDTPGIKIIRETEDRKLGMRFLRQSTIEFEDVRVPVGNMLGGPDDPAAFLPGLDVLNRTRPYCFAWSVGTARGALDFSRDWLRAQPNGYNPARMRRIEDELDLLEAGLDDAMRLIIRASYLTDRGLSARAEAAMAKSSVPRVTDRVYQRVLQLMGSEGSSEQHLVEKWYRDAVTFDLVEGTSQILKLTVSRAMYAQASVEAGVTAAAGLATR